ncbi:uncharacterized protein N7473_008559 [Penicillium subrubescens]|uniref:uncharacterized protein n=1 Tax=Penicillium subrubescens TaxID=1316194 RepID=UPI0025452593|nr:uncharacterized protein N7473_008559 [Penicillium subrubescens]KAJ5892331.1 hypothetical protein N7473_008559 [Penicillium subrubescens]
MSTNNGAAFASLAKTVCRGRSWRMVPLRVSYPSINDNNVLDEADKKGDGADRGSDHGFKFCPWFIDRLYDPETNQ